MDVKDECTSPSSPRSPPRQRSLKYFEKCFEAENYARLLGRPRSITRRDIRASRLALNIVQLQQRDGVWQFSAGDKGLPGSATSSANSSICSWSMVSSEPSSPAGKSVGRLSTISTAASEEGFLLSIAKDAMGEPTLSKASRSVFNNLVDSDFKHFNSRDNCLEPGSSECDMVPEDSIKSYGTECVKVPLSLHRVLTSVLPDCKNVTDAMVQQLQAAIGQSAQQISMSEDVPPTRVSYLRRSGGASRRYRSGSAPPGKRCNEVVAVSWVRQGAADLP